MMALVAKNPPVNVSDTRDGGLIPGLGRVSLPGKFHGRKRPAVFSPWGCKEPDMTEPKHNR